MVDDYDPTDPPTFNAQRETSDPAGYVGSDQKDDAADEDDDYDPSSFNLGDKSRSETPTHSEHTHNEAASQPEAAQKPKTLGGFVLEESDDEDDQENADTPLSQIQVSTSQSVQDTVAVSKAQDVSLHSAPQDTAASSTSLNGSTTVSIPASTLSPSAPPLQRPLEDQGNIISRTPSAAPALDAVAHPLLEHANNSAHSSTPVEAATGSAITAPTRLPHDKVGQLEERIKNDPKGDIGAWQILIDHYYDKGQYDFARNVYARFFKIFPTATSMWIKYLRMENELDERNRVELIFNDCLMPLASVDVWSLYLDHLRRVLPLTNDVGGKNRATILSAFEVVLDQVGIDPDSGNIWREYIDFVKDGPGTVGGSTWQDAQKVDVLRKAYQRAFKIPHSEFVKFWKEYETFEMSLHKSTGRKHIQEQSPHYMQCRTAKVQLDQRLDGLDRKSLPQLPPLYGYAGEDEFATQVEKWRAWIHWEKEDPLVFKGEDDAEFRRRVLYAYKQATVTLAFYPEIWFEAASWCFNQGVEQISAEGEKFLEKGAAINLESVLLALMKADRIEGSLEAGNNDEVLIRNGKLLDAPYEQVHSALYALRNSIVEKDKRAITEIEESFASLPPEELPVKLDEDNDDGNSGEEKLHTRDEQKKAQIDLVKNASAERLDTLKRIISFVWVAKMQAFRRVQGQGRPVKKGSAPKMTVKGFRGIFSDARPRGPLSSDVYIASALLEWNCYRDASAVKIFERGMKLFPTDENFILEYVKHLIAQNDVTNARVVFESSIPKLTNIAEFTLEKQREKCRPLFAFMHEYESKFGDLSQIHKLEKRMAELYPDEPDETRFSHRFTMPTFDAVHVQIILSPTQARPRSATADPGLLHPPFVRVEDANMSKTSETLPGPNGSYVSSPKRPLEDSDTDSPQRKFIRPDSPMKMPGSARLPTKTGQGANGGGFSTKTYVPPSALAAAGPPLLPPQVDAILRMLPNASTYNFTRLDPAKMVGLMLSLNVDQARSMYDAGQLSRR